MLFTHRISGAALLAVSIAASAAAADYTVDPAHTNVGFSVRHILSKLPGRFKECSGEFTFDPAAPEKSHGTFTAKAASIDTNVEKRDAHLRSQDFFWTEKYPELTLVVKRLVPGKEKATFKGEADITIRGVTKAVDLNIEYLGTEKEPWAGTPVISLEARAKINRKDFGLKWNKALESGGVLVGDEVELILDVEGDAKK